MNYNQFYLTEDGQDLLNRTTQGARLEFTRVAVGNGVVKNIEEMTIIINKSNFYKSKYDNANL